MNNQRGSIATITALCLPVLLGIAGLAIDVGNLYWEKTKLQTAVDAAVLGGGQELPDTLRATSQAQQSISNNSQSPANATITFTNNNLQINVSMTNHVSTYFMGLFGINTVAVSVSAAGVMNGPGGPFNYAIFSGSQTIDLILNGSGYVVKGSVHTNKNLIINGSSINISGAVEAVGTVTLNGSGIVVGSQQPNASNISMPDYSAAIAAAAAAANQVYSGTKTINGSSITTNPIYVKGIPGSITVNGSNFNATGAVMADGNIIINGSGMAAGDSQVCFYSKNGNITLNGSSLVFNGVLYAPHGYIIINGSAITVKGSVVGNQVILNGSSQAVNRSDYPVTSLPVKHVQLIQ
jgi:formylmethanofuran dehydrogenase subunit C